MPAQKDDLAWAHPLVRDWFIAKFNAATEPQRLGWPSILAWKNTLISAPTGSGKTFSAFLVCIDRLVRKALDKNLPAQTEVLYVSPLKALSNDIHKNLTEPLHEILQLAKSRGMEMEEIRVALRTGDTLMRDRQSMLKKPPHILVTTPESFYILLTAEKSRAMLSTVNTIIVDEIHAMLNDKRGSHLSLSLARLDALTIKPAMRIGLSATQKPIEKVAAFLNGNHPNPPVIIDTGHKKQLEIVIEVPKQELGCIASNDMWDEIYDRLTEISQDYRSVLIFVNTRRLAERTAHHLRERLGEDKVAAHHGSLSKKIRLSVEQRLKNGELKILVATASLELGIDIGSIDLVCQIGSARSIAVSLQRIGRAGHTQHATSRGRIFATTRDELMECAALVHAIHQGELDNLIIPDMPLDILAQQMIATCATGDWNEHALFALMQSAYPYQALTFEVFETVLDILSEGVSGNRGRYSAYLLRDKVNHIVKARRGARITAIMNGGAIPETGLFAVITDKEQLNVGTLDEDFAVESNRGDIILLGNTSWRIKRVEAAASRVIVDNAHGAPPSVPFWRGEAPARTEELSRAISALRNKLQQLLVNVHWPIAMDEQPIIDQTIHWLKQECSMNEYGALQLIHYVLQGRAVLGVVPTHKTIVAERFFDEAGGMQLVIHAPFGARINKAWGLALRKKFCRSFNFELQASATDDGLTIALTEKHSFALSDVFHYLRPETVESVVVQAVLQSPIFNTRWRWVATRALALLRYKYGRKVPPNIQRMLADDLLAAVFPDAAACQDNLGGREIILPDHPLIIETMKDILHEALDIDGLKNILIAMRDGDIQCIAIDTPFPSLFSQEIVNANPYAFLDDAPLEERRARAVELRRLLPESVVEGLAHLDETAIQEVKSQAFPDIRNADELHDFLQTVIAFPVQNNLMAYPETWKDDFNLLLEQHRALIATVNKNFFWVSMEKARLFSLLYPDVIFMQVIAEIKHKTMSRDEVLLEVIRGWMFYLVNVTEAELSQFLLLPENEIHAALLQLEASGLILRGHFQHHDTNTLEWCERRLLARIHRYTIDRLRKQIAPVTAEQYVRWLFKWHGLTQATQTHGEQGLLSIINQLQGFDIPAKSWEKQIFAKRMTDYTPELLDRLCLSGLVGWGRLTPPKKGVTPTSVVPITFFVRENADWMPVHHEEKNSAHLSSLANQIHDYLQQHGASFFADIVKGVGHLKSQVENSLWELVAAGLITADGFDNLRSLIDVRRRLDKRRRLLQLRYSTGRWSLLKMSAQVSHEKKLESACRVLLNRYGVVFRDILMREKNMPPWRDLLMTFRRLEDRGEIRGGRFIEGFRGEQFALAHVIDGLRKMREEKLPDENMTLASVDPLNLIGIILPGEKITPRSKVSVTIKDGLPQAGS